MATLPLLAAFVAAAAFANGANDVSKGVATLVGSGLAGYRRAIGWGTLWTVAGGVAAILVTAGLAETFSTGLLEETPVVLDHFLIAVAAGVTAWVAIASRTGLPVSTTHAMTGAILGAAVAAGGAGSIQWVVVVTSVAVPLALSPLAAGAIAYFVHAAAAPRLAAASRYCVCLDERRIGVFPVGADGNAVPAHAIAQTEVVVDAADACARNPAVSAGVRLTDAAHWATSAALSFARGMNDNPKLIALALGAAGAAGIGAVPVFLAGAAAMGAGSWLYGRCVTHTLAEEVSEIDPLEGLSASSVAAVLVLVASVFVLPVSTTHVATGAIVGAGLRNGAGAVRWATIRAVTLAWLVTLPAAALAAAAAWHTLAAIA